MPEMEIKASGVIEVGTWLKKVQGRVRNMKWALERFRGYIEDKRIPAMFKGGGRVYGPWGAEFTRWARNTPWVRRAKADGRVFFKHGRSKSSVQEAFKFWGVVKSRGGFKCSLRNTHQAIKFLEAGFPEMTIVPAHKKALAIPMGFGQTGVFKMVTRGAMEPRKIQGFRLGDQRKLVQILEKGALEP